MRKNRERAERAFQAHALGVSPRLQSPPASASRPRTPECREPTFSQFLMIKPYFSLSTTDSSPNLGPSLDVSHTQPEFLTKPHVSRQLVAMLVRPTPWTHSWEISEFSMTNCKYFYTSIFYGNLKNVMERIFRDPEGPALTHTFR